MSSMHAELYPNQILAGYKKLKNNFMRINWATFGTSKNDKVRYCGIQIYVKRGKSYEWVSSPSIVILNAVCGRVKTYEEREKHTVQDRPSFTFRKSSKYKRNGVDEHLGEAICALYEAYLHQTKKALSAGQVKFFSDKICCQVQFDAPSPSGGRVPIDNPIIRVLVPFRQQKDRSMKLDCDIFDMRKPIDGVEFARRVADKDDPTHEDTLKLEHATINDEEEITLENINKLFTSGSIISGLIAIPDVCLSSQGISCPCKAGYIMIKPGSGKRYEAGKLFNNQLESLCAAAASCEIAEDDVIDSDDEEPTGENATSEEPEGYESDGVPKELEDDAGDASDNEGEGEDEDYLKAAE